MLLTDLVGYQLVDLTDDCLTVEKSGVRYQIAFTCVNEMHCCEYADVRTQLLFDRKNIALNPVITKVVVDGTFGSHYKFDLAVITFFGIDRAIAKVEAEAGSSSGYCYGSCVTVHCNVLDINETLVSW